MLTGKASYTLTSDWAADVENSYTISLEGRGENIEALQAGLRDISMIEYVNAVPDKEVADILIKRLGTERLPDGLELPKLIEIQLTAGTTISQSELSEVITPFVPKHQIFKHSNWVEQVRQYLFVVRMFALLTSGVLIVATVLIVGFATHSSLYSRRDVISVLHRFGAQDRYIASMFQKRFWSLGVRSGAFGAIMALAVVAGLVWVLMSENYFSGILPEFSIALWDLVILCLIPFGAGYVAQLTARRTVMSALKSLF